jgi:transposase
MNSDSFEEWIDDYFIPSFQAKYPGKKCSLVLDNAPYHIFGMFNPLAKSVTMANLSEKLRSLGVLKIKVTRENGQVYEFSVPRPGESWGRGQNKPTADEVKRATLKAMKEAGDSELLTWLENRFNELGWEVIFTPPYLPAFQPIELLWADCKNYIAKNYTTGRNFETIKSDFVAKSQTVDGAKLIRHAEDRMNTWIQLDTILSGSLDELIVPEDCETFFDSYNVKFYTDDELNEMQGKLEDSIITQIFDDVIE